MIIKEETTHLFPPKKKRGRQPKNQPSSPEEEIVKKGNKKKGYLQQLAAADPCSSFGVGGVGTTTTLNSKKTLTDPLRPWRESCLYVITPQTFYNQRDDNDWEFFTTRKEEKIVKIQPPPPSSSIITDERVRIAVRLMIKFHEESCNVSSSLNKSSTSTTESNRSCSSGGILTSSASSENHLKGVNVAIKKKHHLSFRGLNNSTTPPSAVRGVGYEDSAFVKTSSSSLTNEIQILSPLWNIDTAFSTPGTNNISVDKKTAHRHCQQDDQEENNSFPSVIYATYSYDLNIIKIHEAIRAKFSCEIKTLPKYKKEAELLRKKQSLRGINGCTIVERREYGRKATELEEKILKIETNEEWFKYVKVAKPLLERYVKVASEEALGIVVIGLGGGLTVGGGGERRKLTVDYGDDEYNVANDDEPENQEEREKEERNKKERLLIIEEYLKIAGNYIGIHVVPIQPETIRCPICQQKQDESMINDDHGTLVCECGRESICVARSATFRDSARIDTGVKNSYEDLANFIKRLDAFEGKQRTPPPSCLYDQLENYFASKPLECGMTPAQIRELPLDENGKKRGTSIPLLEEALLRTNNSAFYKDVELIAHKFWGWKIADISSSGLRRTLIADYIATQKVYDTIKERESSLNVNLRLYFHLKARDFPCELSDFKIVSSRDSLEYHSRMFEVMCERTGLKFTPII